MGGIGIEPDDSDHGAFGIGLAAADRGIEAHVFVQFHMIPPICFLTSPNFIQQIEESKKRKLKENALLGLAGKQQAEQPASLDDSGLEAVLW
jgi:hypothetical protein